MKFLHVADIHLGFEQYGVRERFNDFSRAFIWLMKFANTEKVDFVLLSGDLFHKRVVDPIAMQVAIMGLSIPNCPVLAIEGNHEKAFFQDQKSWVDFLSETGNINLLDHDTVYCGDARICGIKYAGALTDSETRSFSSKLDRIDGQTIMMLHAGLEGQLSHAGRLTNETVDGMDNVDYLALGHIHKPYISSKAYNPGSPETVSADESLWPNRGALLVEAESCRGGNIEHKFIVPPRRTFHRFDIGFNGCEDPKQLYLAMEYIASLDIAPGAVLDVILTGQIQFPRSDFDIKGAQVALDALDPLVTHIRNESTPVGFNLSIDGSENGIDTERAILSRIVERDARYRGDIETWVDKALTVKNLALTSHADAVVEYMEAQ